MQAKNHIKILHLLHRKSSRKLNSKDHVKMSKRAVFKDPLQAFFFSFFFFPTLHNRHMMVTGLNLSIPHFLGDGSSVKKK